MCRLVAYLGYDLLLAEVLVKPPNSIVMQSLYARESTIPTNGDGFGVGWYTPTINDEPALFTSIFPAWNDRNLLNLAAKIESPCFFGHVRAASNGGVNTYNCHPFVNGRWMLMHNGDTYDFIAVKRHLRHLLDDDIYHWIQGETDSEHLFALFLQLSKGKDLSQLDIVGDLLQETLYTIIRLVQWYGSSGPSYFNVCLTDGHRLIASRYCTDSKTKPESMHYSQGSHFVSIKGHFHMLKKGNKTNCVLVTSERLTNVHADWQDVPANHLLLIDVDKQVYLRPI